MTKSEARTVIAIMLTAHGNCLICARSLLGKFAKYFPQFADLAEKEFERSLKLSELDKEKVK
jgi:hypothetical protein